MENQRIRLSKAMLKNALMRLLKEKPIEKISIYELCAAAQINRTTFYKYYGSQYELLADTERISTLSSSPRLFSHSGGFHRAMRRPTLPKGGARAFENRVCGEQ